MGAYETIFGVIAIVGLVCITIATLALRGKFEVKHKDREGNDTIVRVETEGKK